MQAQPAVLGGAAARQQHWHDNASRSGNSDALMATVAVRYLVIRCRLLDRLLSHPVQRAAEQDASFCNCCPGLAVWTVLRRPDIPVATFHHRQPPLFGTARLCCSCRRRC
jgi:hypothetical protein